MSTTPDPSYFATRLQHDPRRAEVWRHLTRHLARYVPENASVLELGAGYCYFINSVPAARRVAIDRSSEMLRWKEASVEGLVGDAIEMLRTIGDAQFDFILASNFLEHLTWPQLEEMIVELVRVLRQGGRLGVIQPNFRLAARRYFDDYTHRTIFTDVSLADWLRSSGLDVVRSEARFLPLTAKGRMSSLSFLMPLYLALPFRPLAGQMFVLAERPR